MTWPPLRAARSRTCFRPGCRSCSAASTLGCTRPRPDTISPARATVLAGAVPRRFHPRLFAPPEQTELLRYALGITNLVARGSARADELTTVELRDGGRLLESKLLSLRPTWVAVLGVSAYRAAFGRPRSTVGPQPDRLGQSRVRVLPNPSGLNAHYTVDTLAVEFARLRVAAQSPRSGGGDDLDLDQPVADERLDDDRRRRHDPTAQGSDPGFGVGARVAGITEVARQPHDVVDRYAR